MSRQYRPQSPEGRRVGYLGALILATATLLAGFSVYLVMEQQSRTVLSQSLRILLQEKIHVFSNEVDQGQGIDSPAAIHFRHQLIETMQAVDETPDDRIAQDRLKLVAQSLLDNVFLSVTIFGGDGRELVNIGQTSTNPALSMPLKTGYPSTLLWDQQFILTAGIDVIHEGRAIGHVVTEMAMPKLTEAFNTVSAIGETSEILLCKALDDGPQNMQCFLNGFREEQFLKKQTRLIDGVPIPMDHALRGEAGLMLANDYRSEPVAAAYGPVGPQGLGMVLKIDQTELYAPITSNLKFIAPLIILLVAVGVLLLRWMVTPLVQGLVSSERAATSSNLDLERSKERLRQVIQHAPYSIHEMDTDGKLLSINPAGLAMSGREHESDLIGTDFLTEHVSVQDRSLATSMMQASLSGETSAFEFTGVSGKIYHATLVPVADTENNILSIMGWTQDITEAKLHSEQIQRSQKMDALGKLTGGIAHDFNNMLGIILGYTEMLAEALAEQPALASFADEIQKAGERGAKLTRRLQGFSKQTTQTDKQLLDINELLAGLQHLLEKTLTARIDLKMVCAEQLWPVLLDASELEDAIINISINAMHAMESTGHFLVETENVHLGKAAAHSLNLASGDYVLLSLTDTGCGMDRSVRDKIFDPFYTTKGEKGTGLGLSQVLSFVARSKGAIHVASDPGTGSRFELYFSRAWREGHNKSVVYAEGGADKKTGAKQKASDDKDQNLDGSETILIVDDEAGLLSLISRLLQRRGYQVFAASGGEEALKILEAEKIDLMLSDIIMPKMDGFELAAIVTQKYPHVKIQLASGFADRVVERTDDHIGTVTARENWLHKPYSARVLTKKLRELLD